MAESSKKFPKKLWEVICVRFFTRSLEEISDGPKWILDGILWRITKEIPRQIVPRSYWRIFRKFPRGITKRMLRGDPGAIPGEIPKGIIRRIHEKISQIFWGILEEIFEGISEKSLDQYLKKRKNFKKHPWEKAKKFPKQFLGGFSIEMLNPWRHFQGNCEEFPKESTAKFANERISKGTPGRIYDGIPRRMIEGTLGWTP